MTVIICVVVTVSAFIHLYSTECLSHNYVTYRPSPQIPFSLVWSFDFFKEDIFPFVILFGFLYLIIPRSLASPKFLFFYKLQLEMLEDPTIIKEFYYLSDNEPRVQYLSYLIKSIKFLRLINDQAVPVSYFNDDWCILLAKYCVHFEMYSKALDFFV